MCRILAELLQENKTLLSADMMRLEMASGQNSIDVKLTAEILRKVRQKTRELGLDPKDTNGKELYNSLNNIISTHDSFINKRLGLDYSSPEEYIAKIIKSTLSLDVPKKVWGIKPAVLKKLLSKSPPKNVMKILGYRSSDSMLKRENPNVILALSKICESNKWTSKYYSLYRELIPNDFEDRSVEILDLSDKNKFSALLEYTKKEFSNIYGLKEAGAVAVLPLPIMPRPGFTIAMLSLLLHSISDVRLHSAFYKLHQIKHDFGDVVSESALSHKAGHVLITGVNFDWRSVREHFGRSYHNHPEVLEPHVSHEDLCWKKGEELLYRLEPALHFWSDMEYVGEMHDGLPVSFNIIDVAINCVNHIPYEQRTYIHMQEALGNEIFVRYMGTPALEAQAIKELDYRVLEHWIDQTRAGVF